MLTSLIWQPDEDCADTTFTYSPGTNVFKQFGNYEYFPRGRTIDNISAALGWWPRIMGKVTLAFILKNTCRKLKKT